MAEPSTAGDPPSHSHTHEGGKEESNLCRICRGEATEHEPLYHPCKCSGSIMYVHQECLMEWLSHSQKKHCELCKTSFRFTKLYSPDMPDKLPTRVFLSKAAAHTAQNCVYWLRGCLVLCTWAIWLPWTMRFVWWGLFWLADVGWVKDPNTYARDGVALANNTTTASNATTTADIDRALMREMLRGPAILRLTSWMFRLMVAGNSKGVLNQLTPDNHMQSQNLIANHTRLSDRGTLLSGVDFLSSFTTSPLVNRVLIDVLEGQIITVALVALIILVLLIREWVVQQQPIVDLANDNDDNMRQALQRHAAHRQPREGERRPHRPVHGRRRTSLLLQEPDDFVRSILEQAEDDNTLYPSSEKAKENHIADLHARVIAARSTLRRHLLRRMPDDGVGASEQQHQAQELLKDVEESLRALKIDYAHAVRDADVTKLRLLRGSLRRFRRTLALLPGDAARTWRTDTDQIRDSMKNMLPLVKLKTSIRGYNAHREGSANEHRTPEIRDQGNHADLSQREDEAATPRMRPVMPPRDESSVATEIQRNLQEGSAEVEDKHLSESEQHIAKAETNNQESDTDSYENVEQMTDDLVDQYMDIAAPETASGIEHMNGSQDDKATAEVSASPPGQESPTLGLNPKTSTAPEEDVAPPAEAQEPPQESLAADDDARDDAGVDTLDRSSDNSGDADTAPIGVLDRITNWLWGDLRQIPEPHEGIEEHVAPAGQEVVQRPVQDANPAPAQLPDDIPQPNELMQAHDAPVQDENAANGPAPAPGLFDIDAGDDVEDLEGVMELIGMQGGLGNLFTNAMFASVFVSCTIVIAVWIPFLFGKVALTMVAHPVSLVEAPFRIVTFITNVVYDLGIIVTASILQWLLLKPLLFFVDSWHDLLPSSLVRSAVWPAFEMSTSNAVDRSSSRMMATLRSVLQGMDVAYSHLTFDSHLAVRALQRLVAQACEHVASATADAANFWLNNINSLEVVRQYAHQVASRLAAGIFEVGTKLPRFPVWLLSGNLTITYTRPEFLNQASSIVPVWTALDRSLVTIIGYIFIAFMGAMYLMRLAPLAHGRQNKKIESVILEILQQGGGIAKVVLIISIEMLVFPLYCGLLLDGAMLPLFKDSTLKGRVRWSLQSPWTSLFVHWFIGTAYMFHFALFVAMCRRIFRKGVLYFIRDPDDPTFHPVRDVLERSVISQLRKIASSALIYGGLVIVCIGTLIWSLANGLHGILPIQWRSTTEANAFPLDLVVFLFTRPLVVRHFALSEWLQEIYKWSFKKCARFLRLTHFLFGKDVEDERGKVERRGFHLQPTAGKWLRVPANDAVRVGRGNKAFVEVDDDNRRIDGISEPEHEPGKGPNNGDFHKIFVPHHFRLRMGMFIACLWTMTAVIGLMFTILPLVLGRALLSLTFGSSAPINDVYAFAVGLLVVCATVSTASKAKTKFSEKLTAAYRDGKLQLQSKWPTVELFTKASHSLIQLAIQHGPRIACCCYVYSTLWVGVALTLAALLHLYILAPLEILVSTSDEPHVVRLSESVVIGIQLVRVMIALLKWDNESRSSRAIHAIFADGYSRPHSVLATRYLFIPLTFLSTVAVLAPPALGRIASFILKDTEHVRVDATYLQIFSYPATLGLTGLIYFAHLLIRATGRWRMRIRDEVFLIGERLHNYGERKPPSNAPHSTARVLS